MATPEASDVCTNPLAVTMKSAFYYCAHLYFSLGLPLADCEPPMLIINEYEICLAILHK